jgi:hypothetical protein
VEDWSDYILKDDLRQRSGCLSAGRAGELLTNTLVLLLAAAAAPWHTPGRCDNGGGCCSLARSCR